MNFKQTTYTSLDTGKRISLPFPTELLNKLIADNTMVAEQLSITDVTKLFPILVGRWLDGGVQTEELSSVANFFIGITKYKNNELSNALLSASELSYYVRNTNSESGEPLHNFVAILRTYYANSRSVT